MHIQTNIYLFLSTHISAQSTSVDQKDAISALAAASTTIAGFALVFLGIIITRPVSAKKTRKTEIRLVAGWILVFWLLALSAFGALAWFYFNAPGSIHIPVFGKTDSGFLYQSSWILFLLTSIIAVFIVVSTIRTVIGRDDKVANVNDDS